MPIGWLYTMANILPNPDTYQGLPYLASVQVGNQHHTAVVDFVLDGTIHYYHIDTLGVDNCSAFLLIVEAYYNSGASKLVPLSVYISANNYGRICTHGYRTMSLDDVTVTGLCPTHWFPKVKVKWVRKDLRTGQITKSKLRRPAEEIAADKARKAERRKQRGRPPKDAQPSQVG